MKSARFEESLRSYKTAIHDFIYNKYIIYLYIHSNLHVNIALFRESVATNSAKIFQNHQRNLHRCLSILSALDSLLFYVVFIDYVIMTKQGFVVLLCTNVEYYIHELIRGTLIKLLSD